MLKTKIISSLDKCFLDEKYETFDEINKINIYRNTDASFQLLPYNEDDAKYVCTTYIVKVEGDLAKYVTLKTVENVPNYIPFFGTPKVAEERDPNYLRVRPGLYPDVLMPISVVNRFNVVNQTLRTIWIDIKNDGTISPGEHTLKITLNTEDDRVASENKITINVIDAFLPEQDTKVTQWFYADCLADYYDVKVWSKKHFDICRRFIKMAADNGINMILTPIFTPPLDTAIGGERTTTQLVKINVTDGEYEFDFSLVDKWIDMLRECGIKYFEMSHLFTQWGAEHAPKIVATVNGKRKKIFGWQTDASSKEYVDFLNKFLKEFTAHLDKLGLRDYVYFHISDEPSEKHIEQYKQNKKNLQKVLKGWKLLDAMSHVEFYKQGLCEIPVAVSSSIEDFLKEDIKERWVYYCWEPDQGYSNRYLGVHLARTRFMGIQMYKYGIEGFLQWGYNFYNNRFSYDNINPFLNSNAGYWSLGGDAVTVYPGNCGRPIESLRLISFKQGLEDIRALKLCEQYYSKDEIIRKIEAVFGENIVFSKCADDTATMQKIRDTIDQMIINKI